jgi:hypothetical protein
MIKLSDRVLNVIYTHLRRNLVTVNTFDTFSDERQTMVGISGGCLILQVIEPWELSIFYRVCEFVRSGYPLEIILERLSGEIWQVPVMATPLESDMQKFSIRVDALLCYLILTIDNPKPRITQDVAQAILRLRKEMNDPFVSVRSVEFPDSLLGYLQRVLIWAEATHKQTLENAAASVG